MQGKTSAEKQGIKDKLIRQGFLPIFVCDELDSKMLVAGAIDAGCAVLEYTCRRKDAREMIPWIKREYPHVAVFAASLVDGPRSAGFLSGHRENFLSIEEAVDLGADGLVSFLRFRPETYERYGNDLVIIPGVHTPNEAIEQLELGADLVKMIGSTPFGSKIAGFGKVATHGLFPIMVSGGVTPQTIPDVVREGAALVSAGFDGILEKEIEKADRITRQVVTDALRGYLSAVKEARLKYQPRYHDAIERGKENPLAGGGWIR